MSAPKHKSTDYSKWDHLDDDSDDETKDKRDQPLLEDRKTLAIRERDVATQRRFEEHLAKFVPTEVPKERRTVVSRFVAVCDKGSEKQSNIFRYGDIIAVTGGYSSVLLTLPMVNALCKLQKDMVNSVKGTSSSNPVIQDAQLLMDAINTLEACRRVPNVTNFFEAVCRPSQSDHAKELMTMYVKQEFAKRAMMRHIFEGAMEGAGDMGAFDGVLAQEELEFDAKVLGKPPPGSSARPGGSQPSFLQRWGGEEALILAGTAALLAVGISFAAYAWYYLQDIMPTPAKPPEGL